jgi:hypothetical protein
MTLATDQDGEISDQPARCPECGAAGGNLADRAPMFVWIAAAALALAPFVPRLLLVIPVLVTVACAIAAMVRRERYREGAWLVLCLAVALLVWEGVSS